MQKESKRKKWTKPMLTVLARGSEGEGVLAVCKRGGFAYPGPEAVQNGCDSFLGLVCQSCLGEKPT